MCDFKTRTLIFWTTFFTLTAVICNIFIFHFAFICNLTELDIFRSIPQQTPSNSTALSVKELDIIETTLPLFTTTTTQTLPRTTTTPNTIPKVANVTDVTSTESPEEGREETIQELSPTSDLNFSSSRTKDKLTLTEALTKPPFRQNESFFGDSEILDSTEYPSEETTEEPITPTTAESAFTSDELDLVTENGTFLPEEEMDPISDLSEAIQLYQKKNALEQERNISQPQVTKVSTSSDPFQRSPWIMALAFAAFGLGALISFGGFHLFARRFGIRTLFTVAVLFSGLATLLAPISLSYDIGYFIIMRLIQGFGFGGLMPTVGSIGSNWAALKQASSWVTILLCSVQVAFMLSVFITALFHKIHLGWEFAFYLSGTATVVSGILWVIVFRDNPRKHPWIGGVELNRVLNGKLTLRKRVARSEISIKSLLTSLSVWAVLISGFAHFAGLNLILLFSPLYLATGLEFETLEIGLIIIVCGFMQLVGKLIASYSYEIFPSKSETMKVKFYTLLSLLVMGASFLGLGFMNLQHNNYASILWIVASGASGLNLSGLYKSLRSIVKGSQVQFLFSLLMVFSFLLFIILPFFVFGIVWSSKSWRIILVTISAIQIIAALFFGFFGSGETGDYRERSREGKSPFDGLAEEEDNISMEEGIIEMKRVNPKVIS